MARPRLNLLEQLTTVFFGSPRARILTSAFGIVVAVLLAYLFQSSQRIESVALPTGLGRADAPEIGSVVPDQAPDVLVLNSYHVGYTWSDNEVAGILAKLSEGSRPANVAVEYLDCKRFPAMDHFDRVRDLLAAKYASHPPSVVLVADNPALLFALLYRHEPFLRAPIVFCGINGFNAAMLGDATDMTGVAEVLDGATTIRTALLLQPGVREVFVAHDDTVTGKASRREVEAELRALQGVEVHYLEKMPLAELLARVEKLPPDSVLLALSYSIDAEGRVVNHEQIAHLLSQHSSVPVYGVHQERLGYGILGGSLTGGRLQGERAAEMVQRILAGEKVSSIPVDLKSPTRLMFDYPQLERFGIPQSALPPNAIVVNRPVSMLVAYRSLFASAATLVLVLISGIALLGLSIYRRQQAEAALSESERNFKTLFESAADMMFIEGPDGRMLDANAEAVRALGYEKPALLGITIHEITAPEHHQSLAQSRESAAEGRSSVLECELVTKTGTRIPAELHSRAVAFSTGQAVLTIARDISERRKAEAERNRLFAQFAESQKMESIGRLAGSVAHDFNNILTSIFGYGQLLLHAIPSDDSRHRHVQVIQQAAESAAALTRQLLQLSRGQSLDVRIVQINQVVERVQLLLARVLGDQVGVEFRPGETLPVRADPGQLEQVVMNLVVNARDAMQSGGTVVIETSTMAPPGGPDGQPFVELSVTDTGIGMPPEVQARIFEPFFSTKDPSKGTGLGLATVRGIVDQCRGRIIVDSALGRGTTIRVLLPAVLQETKQPATDEPPKAVERTGRETVLVVDDNDSIVSMLSVSLAALGYEVLGASHPGRALALARARHGPIDLMVTDVVMREMNGRELALAIRGLRPGIKLIFMSGHTENLISEQEVRELGATLVQKPFTPSDLAMVVREVLGRASSP